MVPKRIAVFGASTCEGKVDPQGGGFVGKLKSWHEGTSEQNHVYNLGISGDTTEGILTRLISEAKPRNPDLIIIHPGANDVVREGSKDGDILTNSEDFQNNIRRIIIRSQSFGDTIFVSPHPIDETRTSPVSWKNVYYLMSDIKAYTDLVRMVCEEMQIEYIDVFSEWMALERYTDYLFLDGLHPNSKGHQLIFEKLKLRLEQLYGQ